MEIGQNTYKLILLDTNALREIVTNTNLAGKGFYKNFLVAKISTHHVFLFIMHLN